MIFVNGLSVCQNTYLIVFSIDNVQSDLLHKYDSKDDILILTVRLAVIVAVILTVPVLFFTVSKKRHAVWKSVMTVSSNHSPAVAVAVMLQLQKELELGSVFSHTRLPLTSGEVLPAGNKLISFGLKSVLNWIHKGPLLLHMPSLEQAQRCSSFLSAEGPQNACQKGRNMLLQMHVYLQFWNIKLILRII